MPLLVEELFDYAAGNLNTLDGGTGWTGAWATDASTTEQARVVAGDLSYAGVSNGSETNTNKMLVNNEGSGTVNHYIQRDHNAIPNTVNGAVYWLAFTIASNLAKGGSIFWLNKLTSDIAGNNPQTLLQWTSALADAKVQCGSLLYTGSASYVSHVVVFKITMSGAGATPVRVDVYCDVDMTTDPAGWTPKVTSTSWYVPASITQVNWDSETNASSSADDKLYMDNLRWATTSYEAGGNAVPSNVKNSAFLQFFRQF